MIDFIPFILLAVMALIIRFGFPMAMKAADELDEMLEVQAWAKKNGVDPDFKTEDDFRNAQYEYVKHLSYDDEQTEAWNNGLMEDNDSVVFNGNTII